MDKDLLLVGVLILSMTIFNLICIKEYENKYHKYDKKHKEDTKWMM